MVTCNTFSHQTNSISLNGRKVVEKNDCPNISDVRTSMTTYWAWTVDQMSLSNCHRSGFIVISFVSSTSLLSLNCQIQFQLRFDVERQRVPTGLLKLGCHVAIGACISTLCCVYECIHYLGSIHGLVANVITVTTQHNASVNSLSQCKH